MNRRPQLFAGSLMMAAWVAGCGTPQINRIDQNREVYESWPIETKQAVLDGKVEVGMTPEMVRVAWGQPTEVISRSTGPGEEEIWIYRKGGTEEYPMGPGGVYGGGYPGAMGGNTVGIGVATGRGMGTVVGPVVGMGGMGGMVGPGGVYGGYPGTMGGMGGMGSPVMTGPSRVEEKEVVFRNGVVHRADSP